MSTMPASREAPRELTRAQRSERSDHLARVMHAPGDEAGRHSARSELIRINMRVAHAIAARYSRRGVPLEDLEQVACEGLVKAVDRFDPTRQHDLLSFAVPTIRGEVLRYFRDSGWSVRPPRRIQELQTRIAATTDELAVRQGGVPRPSEVCTALQIERKDFDEARQALGCFQPSSLQQPVAGRAESGATVGDAIADDTDDFAATEAGVVLTPLLRTLSERDRQVLHLRYVRDMSQREIGEVFGVAQMQVSRWLSRIHGDLNDQLSPAS